MTQFPSPPSHGSITSSLFPLPISLISYNYFSITIKVIHAQGKNPDSIEEQMVTKKKLPQPLALIIKSVP